MRSFETLILIAKTYETDALGQRKPVETSRTVYPYLVSSATQSEFFEAGRNGFKAEYRITLASSLDYQNEELCEFMGKRYIIYRTYLTDGGGIELYLRDEAGTGGKAE